MNILNIENIVNNLGKSPIYCLTNSSMENSHTDFWSWIIKELDADGLKIFGIAPLEGEKVSDVKREWNHFDLYIKTNKRCIVIENKIKSIHTNEQLKEYSEKISKICKGAEGTIQILATFFEEAKELTDNWGAITYADILNNLQNITTENTFIKEYIDVLDNLNKLIQEFRASEFIYEIECPENTAYIELLNTLETARLDDIYKKYKTLQLKKYLTTHLGTKYPIETYFVSGQGGLSLDIYCKKGDDKNIEEAEKKSIKFRITLHGIRYVRELLIGTKTDFYLHNKQELLSGGKSLSFLDKLDWLEVKGDEISSMRNPEEYNIFGQKGQYPHLSKYKHFNILKTYGKFKIGYDELFNKIKADIDSICSEIEKIDFDRLFSDTCKI